MGRVGKLPPSPFVPGGQKSKPYERDTFDNVLLTRPGGVYPQSQWDGNDGQPLEQLRDTHTLECGLQRHLDQTPDYHDRNLSTGIAAVAYIEQQGGF